MYNKDLLVKTFDTVRKAYEKTLKEKDTIIAECLKVGNLQIIKCNEDKCDAIWIREQFTCQGVCLDSRKIGACDCGKILCDKHCTLILDDYGNDRFLCQPCFISREKRNGRL